MTLSISTTILVLLFPQFTVGRFTESKNETACHKPADVVFVLDASSSIYGPDFRKQLDFVGTVIQDLRIDPSMVRCGLVTYGDQVREEFGLRRYSSAQTAMTALPVVKQLRGNTRTDLALRRMRQMLEEDKRPGVPYIGIVITDGQSDYPLKTQLEAETAHKAGIALFAVGIGMEVDQRELRSIASQENFRFNVGNFDGLTTIRRILTARACDVESQNDQAPPQVLLQNVNGCSNKLADVMFVLDGSGSIWGPDFRRQMKFVSDMVASFQVSESGTHVGVLTFGDYPKPQFDIDRYSTVTDAQRAVERITQQRGSTNTADALRYVRQTAFIGRRHRVGAVKIALVITDGHSNNPTSTVQEATRVKDDGVTVFAIGVGSGADRTELYSIASEPSDQHVLIVENYAALGSIKQRLMSRACLNRGADEGPLAPGALHAQITAATEKMALATIPITDPTTTQPIQAVDCDSMKPADLMFSLPSSIDDQETREALRLIESMTKVLRVGDGHIRVGLAPRVCHSLSGFSLAQGNRSDKVSRYIEQQNPSGRVEETAAMLRYLRDVGFNTYDTDRAKETEKVALVVVDRRSAKLTEASVKEARRVLQRGIRVVLIVVGRGETALENEVLSQMTGCDNCLLNTDSYTGLNALVEPLRRTIITQLCSRSSMEQ